ncbi:MAG: hypothetical protein ACLFVU_03620 [Phycisphaerae bacterium]
MKRALLAITLALVAVPALAQEDGEVNIPVKKVVLFSSGVGYFEHSGTVEGDATMTLTFKADQINDILKSMVLMDQDGGTVTRVNYASKAPTKRALQSFAIDLSGDTGLVNLLKQIRGAKVTVEAPSEITGKIVSVEKRTRTIEGAGKTPMTVTEQYLTLLTDEGLKSLPLSSITNVQIADEKLRKEMNQALELLFSSKDTDRKPVVIRFRGKGKRRVRVGYVVETPVWKVSYRLSLGDKPHLQGWAIVENASDTDWKDVELSLVSGRPISFVMDLYTSLYMPRPVVQPRLYASLRPRRYDEGIAKQEMERVRGNYLGSGPTPSASKSRRGRNDGVTGGRPADEDKKLDFSKTAQAIAGGQTVGELFSFRIKEKVSLPRRRSSMLPIINDTVEAEKVSIYNQNVLTDHPLNGVRLTNNTGMKLLGGPVTVFEDGTYAGDALVDNMVQDEKALMSYAIDLTVTVNTGRENKSVITAGSIDRGVLRVRRLHTNTATYTFKNKGEDARTLVVEHPISGGYELVQPVKFMEKTNELYRFRMELPGEETKQLVVEQQQTGYEQVGLLSHSIGTLLHYARNSEIPQDVRDALAKAARIKRELEDLQSKQNQQKQQKQQIESGQERLRKNIQVVGKDTELGRRYLKKLSAEEDQIEQLEREIRDYQRRIEKKRDELTGYVSDLKVE